MFDPTLSLSYWTFIYHEFCKDLKRFDFHIFNQFNVGLKFLAFYYDQLPFYHFLSKKWCDYWTHLYCWIRCCLNSLFFHWIHFFHRIQLIVYNLLFVWYSKYHVICRFNFEFDSFDSLILLFLSLITVFFIWFDSPEIQVFDFFVTIHLNFSTIFLNRYFFALTSPQGSKSFFYFPNLILSDVSS